MPRTKPTPMPRPAPRPKRPKPKEAIAHIDAAALYLNHLRAHVSPTNTAGHTLLQNLSKSLQNAAASLCYTPKPQPDHPGQTTLGEN